MATSGTYCIKLENHSNQLMNDFEVMRQLSEFFDVTLACGGLTIGAHQLILSACSPYFHSLFRTNPCQHPIVHMKGIPFEDVEVLLDFVYKGEVSVGYSQLESFLETARSLQIKGLMNVDCPQNLPPATDGNLQRPSSPTTTEQPKNSPSKRKRHRSSVSETPEETNDSIEDLDSDVPQDYSEQHTRDIFKLDSNSSVPKRTCVSISPEILEPRSISDQISTKDLVDDTLSQPMIDLYLQDDNVFSPQLSLDLHESTLLQLAADLEEFEKDQFSTNDLSPRVSKELPETSDNLDVNPELNNQPPSTPSTSAQSISCASSASSSSNQNL